MTFLSAYKLQLKNLYHRLTSEAFSVKFIADDIFYMKNLYRKLTSEAFPV